MTPGGNGIWTLIGCRKLELGVCVRQRRGLTLAWGSPHKARTSETVTSNTFENTAKEQGTQIMQTRKSTVVNTLGTKQTGYLECNCASLQGGVRGEAQLHSRVSGGDQQGSSCSQGATVPQRTRHHHEPGEVAHGTARQLQGPRDARDECFPAEEKDELDSCFTLAGRPPGWLLWPSLPVRSTVGRMSQELPSNLCTRTSLLFDRWYGTHTSTGWKCWHVSKRYVENVRLSTQLQQ